MNRFSGCSSRSMLMSITSSHSIRESSLMWALCHSQRRCLGISEREKKRTITRQREASPRSLMLFESCCMKRKKTR